MMQWCPRRTLSETWGGGSGEMVSPSQVSVSEPGQQLFPAFLELVFVDQVFVPELMQFLQGCLQCWPGWKRWRCRREILWDVLNGFSGFDAGPDENNDPDDVRAGLLPGCNNLLLLPRSRRSGSCIKVEWSNHRKIVQRIVLLDCLPSSKDNTLSEPCPIPDGVADGSDVLPLRIGGLLRSP